MSGDGENPLRVRATLDAAQGNGRAPRRETEPRRRTWKPKVGDLVLCVDPRDDGTPWNNKGRVVEMDGHGVHVTIHDPNTDKVIEKDLSFDEVAELDDASDPEAPRDYRLQKVSEVMAWGDPEWVVDDMVPAGVPSLLWADSGDGKSLLALSLAAHVALGLQWAGREVTRGPVVLVDQEGGVGTRLRIKALVERTIPVQLTDDPRRADEERRRIVAALDENLFVLSDTVHLLKGGDVVGFVQAVKATLGERRAVLCVVDTLSVSLAGADENANKDMSAAVEAAKLLGRELGCAALLLHHSGRGDKTHSRGGYAIDCNTAARFRIEREADRPGVVRVSHEKNKDGPLGDDLLFQIEAVRVGTRKDGRPLTGGVATFLEATPRTTKAEKAAGAVDRRKAEKVAQELRKAAPAKLTTNQMRERLGIGKDACIKLLAALVEAGKVVAEDGPNRSRLHSLPPEPTQPAKEAT